MDKILKQLKELNIPIMVFSEQVAKIIPGEVSKYQVYRALNSDKTAFYHNVWLAVHEEMDKETTK